jgi:type 1 glutamine amidotransferase
MDPKDPPVAGAVNDPMMPIAWTKTYTGSAGKSARVFATTLGTSEDLLTEANRRLLVNACYWALGLEQQIKPNANVGLEGEYHPHPFDFDGYVKGLTPSDLR